MSHMSASEKPGARGGAVDRGDHRIGDAAEVDDRLVEDLGAAADLGRQVDALDRSSPRLNQLTSPPDEKAPPGAGDDQRSKRRAVGEPGRGGGQLADQLGAHRVERVGPIERQRADLAVDLDRERLRARADGAQRLGLGGSIAAASLLGSGFGGERRTLTFCDVRSRHRQEPIDEQRRQPARPARRLPVRDARRRGRSTSARRPRSASGSPRILGQVARGGAARWSTQVALDRLPGHRDRGRGAARRAAVHQAPPAAVQHPAARRQVLSVHRRSASTRSSRASTSPASATGPGRVYFGPVLERQARPRDARPARQAVPVPHLRGPGAGPALRRALPRLLHQALPGALRRLHRPRGVPAQHRGDRRTSSPAATATSSATSSARWPRRPSAEEFERAARLPRPPGGGALADGAPQRRGRVARRAPT